MTWLAVALGITAAVLVVLGGISVWMRDEHPPVWMPPEPTRIDPKPFPYDWQEHEDGE